MDYNQIKQQLRVEGFSIASNLYTEVEVNQIVKTIESATKTGQNKQSGVHAIRQLLSVIPELTDLLFTKKLQQLLDEVGGSEYFLTKALYFDKPSDTNWFVAYHQDLSISVDQKEEVNGYIHWTHKNGQYGVQPPQKILNDTITVRIHLDDANVHNGALYVIPGSHTHGVIRPNHPAWNLENECLCEVRGGGVMLMKPLTVHASKRSTNGERRRVIHLEFNCNDLASPLRGWRKRK